MSCLCSEQRLLPLCEPNNCPQIFSVAVRAPQVRDPRTFLLLCVRDREGERAVARPAVPPSLKSDFCYLLCTTHENRGEEKKIKISV